MDKSNTKGINVSIAGRTFPIRVSPDDVDIVKRIVEEINEKVQFFQSTYSRKDKQDVLSMALLTYAVDYHKSLQSNEDDKVNQKLDQLNLLLDKLV